MQKKKNHSILPWEAEHSADDDDGDDDCNWVEAAKRSLH